MNLQINSCEETRERERELPEWAGVLLRQERRETWRDLNLRGHLKAGKNEGVETLEIGILEQVDASTGAAAATY